MNRATGKAQNDSAIFSSVKSLIKAQAYEIDSLPRRKKDSCFYQFNLISVVDAPLLNLFFDETNANQSGYSTSSSEIEHAHYVANYIVGKKETASRVHFVQKAAFESSLEGYDELHHANVIICNSQIDEFYYDAISHWPKKNTLIQPFLRKIAWRLPQKCKEKFNVYWDSDREMAVLDVELPQEEINDLNANTELKRHIRNALAKIFRYQGNFEFCRNYIPF